MNTKGYLRIPSELFYWITFLSKVLPPRSVGTFIELLIGAMLTSSGFVTGLLDAGYVQTLEQLLQMAGFSQTIYPAGHAGCKRGCYLPCD